VPVVSTDRNRTALELFAPIAGTYDRYARLLSFGQDARWRSFLVSRIDARPDETIVDVASGTGAVAIELAGRFGCSVVGVDQSAEMLAEGRRRVAQAGLGERITFLEGRAEALPFPDDAFAGLTFTYLLRYVEDPAATLRELARVVRPGGPIAGLEFFVPPGAVTRLAWQAYVRGGLPLLTRAGASGWAQVGRFLGPSIAVFWERYPLPSLLELWRAAGIMRVDARALSFGGGVVIWGRRGD
jgi:demethylmenaquinone methyltransferase / 2-methoxy-6-polyprenyl-1,4-benzoquinol methylase